MNKGDPANFKEKLSKSWESFVLWFFILNIEQRVLFLIGVALVFSSFIISIKSNPAMICGTILIILAALNPSTIKDFALKWGKGGPEVSLRREAPKKESEILNESTQENPPEEIKIEAEKLIAAAGKRTERERAPEDYLALALKAWEDKNFEKGLGWAYSGLNLNPKNDETKMGLYNTLGMLYDDRKSYDLAEENYKKALEIDVEAYWIRSNLGNTYLDQNNYDDAKQEYMEALRLNPYYAHAHHGLGNIYLAQKKYSNAETKYQEVLKLDPDNFVVHNNLGVLYEKQNKYDLAEIEYQKALHLNPEYSLAYNNLGFVYCDLERWKKALTQFDKALSLNQDLAESIAGKAIALFRLGVENEAVEHYRKAVSLDPVFKELKMLKEKYDWPDKRCEAARELIERL